MEIPQLRRISELAKEFVGATVADPLTENSRTTRDALFFLGVGVLGVIALVVTKVVASASGSVDTKVANIPPTSQPPLTQAYQGVGVRGDALGPSATATAVQSGTPSATPTSADVGESDESDSNWWDQRTRGAASPTPPAPTNTPTSTNDPTPIRERTATAVNSNVSYENPEIITQNFDLVVNADYLDKISKIDIDPNRKKEYFEAFNRTAHHVWQKSKPDSYDQYLEMLKRGDDTVKYNTPWGEVDPRKGFVFEIAASLYPGANNTIQYSAPPNPGIAQFSIVDGKLHITSAFPPSAITHFKGNDPRFLTEALLNYFTAPLTVQGASFDALKGRGDVFKIADFFDTTKELQFQRTLNKLLTDKEGYYDPVFRISFPE